jgi:hypothetical protein
VRRRAGTLVAGDGTAPTSGRALLSELKADPGQVGLETLLREIDKLTAVRALGLPAGLFANASEKLVVAWRARATRSYPSDLHRATAGAADAAGHAVLDARLGDHRRAGRAADQPDP